MISDEQLLRTKTALTADVIDDSEEWAMWAVESGVALIDEVLQLRARLRERDSRQSEHASAHY